MITVVTVGAIFVRLPRSKDYGDSRQTAAVKMVWESYGMIDLPPSVVWITGEALSCGNGCCFKDPWARCVYGTYSPVSDIVNVAIKKDQPIHTTALAHELWHAVITHRYGTEKGYNTSDNSPEFDPDNAVSRANDFLKSNGF